MKPPSRMMGMSLLIGYNEAERCEEVWGSVRVVKVGVGRTDDKVKA